ncbi:MAG: ATPase [Deltaproteobacteria bacterium]|jgi:activator of 2-hydroxyglutaryl-CoA dehydratase|nr:ATPase [Deltaproteobacteria bacterium]MCL5879768.1 ATPase [Deltaproteobacteria bacterium]MDA8304745.1 ATPase [Deltaproteobacteria bacterium]
MVLLDAGTTYAKILNTDTNDRVVKRVSDLEKTFKADVGTGHNINRFAKHSVNEIIALANAGKKLIKEDSFTLLDIGSRDAKYVVFENRNFIHSDWNTECGAFTGQAIEILGNYLNVDYSKTLPQKEFITATCGLLGMGHVFDSVAAGVEPEIAAARLIKGVCISMYRFARKPKKIYLTGGLVNNQLFVKSMPCETVILDRFTLLEGVKEYALNNLSK